MKHFKHIGSNSKFAQLEFISGCEGPCLGINDCRVAGPKPWGGGYTVGYCHPEKERLLKIIGNNEYVDIHTVDYGLKGFWINSVNLSRKGTKDDYEKHLEQLAILRKRTSLKAAHDRRKYGFWKVKTEDIKNALNNSYYRTYIS